MPDIAKRLTRNLKNYEKRTEALTGDKVTRLIDHQHDEEDRRMISSFTGTPMVYRAEMNVLIALGGFQPPPPSGGHTGD